MNDNELELRAAANRLAVLDLGEWQGPEGDCADMRAGIMLARNWIAEHAADDDEAITKEWFVEQGAYQLYDGDETLYVTCELGYDCNVLGVGSWNMQGWCIHNSFHGEKDAVAGIMDAIKTRGDLRKWCKLLNIPLKGATP